MSEEPTDDLEDFDSATDATHVGNINGHEVYHRKLKDKAFVYCPNCGDRLPYPDWASDVELYCEIAFGKERCK